MLSELTRRETTHGSSEEVMFASNTRPKRLQVTYDVTGTRPVPPTTKGDEKRGTCNYLLLGARGASGRNQPFMRLLGGRLWRCADGEQPAVSTPVGPVLLPALISDALFVMGHKETHTSASRHAPHPNSGMSSGTRSRPRQAPLVAGSASSTSARKDNSCGD